MKKKFSFNFRTPGTLNYSLREYSGSSFYSPIFITCSYIFKYDSKEVSAFLTGILKQTYLQSIWFWGLRGNWESRVLLSPNSQDFCVNSGDRAQDSIQYFLKVSWGTSLVVQWLRVHLPMQGTRAWSLVREDSTCHRATKPMCCNYWACVPQLLKPAHSGACVLQLLKPTPRACAPQQEKPPQWEALTPQQSAAMKIQHSLIN